VKFTEDISESFQFLGISATGMLALIVKEEKENLTHPAGTKESASSIFS